MDLFWVVGNQIAVRFPRHKHDFVDMAFHSNPILCRIHLELRGKYWWSTGHQNEFRKNCDNIEHTTRTTLDAESISITGKIAKQYRANRIIATCQNFAEDPDLIIIKFPPISIRRTERRERCDHPTYLIRALLGNDFLGW